MYITKKKWLELPEEIRAEIKKHLTISNSIPGYAGNLVSKLNNLREFDIARELISELEKL